MKKFVQNIVHLVTNQLIILLCSPGILIFFILQASPCVASDRYKDTSVSATIQAQLDQPYKGLYYPVSVESFYKQNGFKLAWIAPDTIKTHASGAMLLLDCVLQYGLNHSDYHPNELLYETLHTLTAKFGKVSNAQKAHFDILLTDAMITLVNNLHYGKLNPDYPPGKTDGNSISGFNAERILADALSQKSISAAILKVQPKSKEYADLQYHMYLLTGLYQGDCYEIPERDIRLMAINMERLRWAAIEDSTYIQVNIPSFTLQFYQPNAINTFKIVVGKPQTPTPTMNSAITYFTTAPDVKIKQEVFENQLLPNAVNNANYLKNNHVAIYDKKGNYIVINPASLAQITKNPEKYFARHASGCDKALGDLVFHFPNPFDVDLHDMPNADFFKQEERDLSSGCVWVANAQKLGNLLLENDGRKSEISTFNKAVLNYQRKTFLLKKPIPIEITYLTCQVIEGELITYKDIYNLDNSLEMALYNTGKRFVMR